jgi:hypothetical protein
MSAAADADSHADADADADPHADADAVSSDQVHEEAPGDRFRVHRSIVQRVIELAVERQVGVQ